MITPLEYAKLVEAADTERVQRAISDAEQILVEVEQALHREAREADDDLDRALTASLSLRIESLDLYDHRRCPSWRNPPPARSHYCVALESALEAALAAAGWTAKVEAWREMVAVTLIATEEQEVRAAWLGLGHPRLNEFRAAWGAQYP